MPVSLIELCFHIERIRRFWLSPAELSIAISDASAKNSRPTDRETQVQLAFTAFDAFANDDTATRVVYRFAMGPE